MNNKFGKNNWINVDIQYVDKDRITHYAVFAFVKRSALAQSAYGQQFEQAEKLADNPQMTWGMNVDYPKTVIKRTPRFRKKW